MGKVFKEKQRERENKKDLEEKKKRNFCLLWKEGKEIVITGLDQLL